MMALAHLDDRDLVVGDPAGFSYYRALAVAVRPNGVTRAAEPRITRGEH